MTTNLKKILASAIAIAACTSGAHAATTACPAVADIKQTDGEYGGYAYTAEPKNAATSKDSTPSKWKGENPMASASDLKNFRFKEAYIFDSKKFVACDYVTKTPGEGTRMILETNAKPIGTAWVKQEQADGTKLPRCAGPNPTACTFE